MKRSYFLAGMVLVLSLAGNGYTFWHYVQTRDYAATEVSQAAGLLASTVEPGWGVLTPKRDTSQDVDRGQSVIEAAGILEGLTPYFAAQGVQHVAGIAAALYGYGLVMLFPKSGSRAEIRTALELVHVAAIQLRAVSTASTYSLSRFQRAIGKIYTKVPIVKAQDYNDVFVPPEN